MFHYRYRNTAAELWQLSMYYIYGSLAGVCNVIFTGAALALTYSRWGTSSLFFRCVMILMCCVFPIIQPLTAYAKAKKQAEQIKSDTDISFDEYGIHTSQDGKKQDIPWKKIKKISKKPTMLVVFTDTVHGYVLTNRILKDDRDKLYQLMTSRIA